MFVKSDFKDDFLCLDGIKITFDGKWQKKDMFIFYIDDNNYLKNNIP
jgi:hypothetical protein